VIELEAVSRWRLNLGCGSTALLHWLPEIMAENSWYRLLLPAGNALYKSVPA